MKIALVTDSTSVLTEEEVTANQIHILPIPIMIGGKTYLEGIDIDASKLFQLEANNTDFPKTSQPSLGSCLELFEQLHADGYDAILAISLASGISGCYQTWQNIARQHPKFGLVPFDSRFTVRLQGELVLAAAKMIANGWTMADMLDKLQEIRGSFDAIFVVDDLNNLSRGGRLSNAGAFIGSVLHIKPLLRFTGEGKIVAVEKIRSMKRAVARLEEIASERTEKLPYRNQLRLFVINSNDLKQAQEILEFVKITFPGLPVTISEFSPVVATHLGEKSLAIAWMLDCQTLNLTK
ncbi:MAG: DegV family protein [Lactobacillus sp.]|nr:DegV family protein [Lactobacillus sp.]MDN6052297.1 DegV family protein [Lactobacillus sp.]